MEDLDDEVAESLLFLELPFMVYNKGVSGYSSDVFKSEGKVLGASWRFPFQETSRETLHTDVFNREVLKFQEEFPLVRQIKGRQKSTAVRGSCSAPPRGEKNIRSINRTFKNFLSCHVLGFFSWWIHEVLGWWVRNFKYNG